MCDSLYGEHGRADLIACLDAVSVSKFGGNQTYERPGTGLGIDLLNAVVVNPPWVN